jgi:hypothetical protein
VERFPERDWKVLRQLIPLALDRYCERTLEDVERVLADRSAGAHARYRSIYRILGERDVDLARAFDDVRRSTAIFHVRDIRHLGLLTPAEYERFSEETRASVTQLGGTESADFPATR